MNVADLPKIDPAQPVPSALVIEPDHKYLLVIDPAAHLTQHTLETCRCQLENLLGPNVKVLIVPPGANVALYDLTPPQSVEISTRVDISALSPEEQKETFLKAFQISARRTPSDYSSRGSEPSEFSRR
jgi:hypothetical protein